MGEKVIKKIALGKVVKVEGGFAYTDKDKKTTFRCKVGDVLEMHPRKRVVSVKPKSKTAAQKKAQELKDLQDDALLMGIEEIDGKSIEELKVLIEGEQ